MVERMGYPLSDQVNAVTQYKSGQTRLLPPHLGGKKTELWSYHADILNIKAGNFVDGLAQWREKV